MLWTEPPKEKAMQKFLVTALIVLLLAAPALGMSKKKLGKLQDAEHKSMHEIVMVDRDSTGTIVGGGLCTAYAIGPHTLLTANHCNDEYTNVVYVDTDRDDIKNNTAVAYKVSRQFDHEDHMLLNIEDVKFIDFKVYVPLSANLNPPTQREHFYFWGNPQGITDQYREGVVMGSMPFDAKKDDPSIEVDGDILYLLTGPVIGGDSGSSIFNEKGERIGIVTYGVDDGAIIGVFPIKFTQAQIDKSLQVVKPDVPLVRPAVTPDMSGWNSSLYKRPIGQLESFVQRGGQHGSHGGSAGVNHNAPHNTPHSGPRGSYHVNPEVRQHFHNGRFDRDYYAAHFGYGHSFYFGSLYWYGTAFWYESIFVYDNCGFMLMEDMPGDWQPGAVYIVEVNGLYYVANVNLPGTIPVQVVF